MCAKMENPWAHIYSRVWLATGLLDNRDYKTALAVAQTGQNTARAHNLPPMSKFIALILGKIYQALGQWAAAYETYQEASALNEQVNRMFMRPLLAPNCALIVPWPEIGRKQPRTPDRHWLIAGMTFYRWSFPLATWKPRPSFEAAILSWPTRTPAVGRKSSAASPFSVGPSALSGSTGPMEW